MNWKTLAQMVESELKRRDLTADEIEIDYIDITHPKKKTTYVSVDLWNSTIKIYDEKSMGGTNK